MTFDEWYKNKYPDLRPESDDLYNDLREVFIAGFDFSADMFDTYTYDEVIYFEEVLCVK